jgi:predicted transcriptional regulator
MPKRDRIEIIAMILQACNEPSTATKMTYSSMLTYHQVTAYIDYLVRLKLLEHSAQEHTYIVTDKGRQYVDLFNKGMKLVSGSSICINYIEEQTKLSAHGENKEWQFFIFIKAIDLVIRICRPRRRSFRRIVLRNIKAIYDA